MSEHGVVCSNCGSTCREGAVFCDSCGEKLPIEERLLEEPLADDQKASNDGNAEPQHDSDAIAGGSDDSCIEATQDGGDGAIEILGALDEKLNRLLALFEERIARTDYETATMKKLSDEVQGYREDLYRKLTLPLIRDIISIRDALVNTQAGYSGRDAESAIVPLSVVDIFANMVKDTLEKYGVFILDIGTGDEFASPNIKTIGKVPTDNPNLHGRIAGVSSDCYMMGEECISPAMATVYVFERSMETQLNAE